MSTPARSRSLALGLAGITSSTLLLENACTRIFSVTLWYHYAFMAICLALYGMALGSVVVYLKPAWFPAERLRERLGGLSLGFGLSTIAGFWLHFQIPFFAELSVVGLLSMALTFLLVAIPFTFSGILVSLVLTRHPEQVGRLYAWDLLGAATGCLLMWALIHPLSGPGLVIFCAALAAASGLAFLWPVRREARRTWRRALVLAPLLLVLACVQPYARLLDIKWVKNPLGQTFVNILTERPMVEEWNTHALITVFHQLMPGSFGWGLSPTYHPVNPPQQLFLTIDAAAGTVITKNTGKPEELTGFRYDVTALAHSLRQDANVLVIGTGGGRDLLTALAFGQKRVTGVEINGDILHLINDTLGDFTGHLDRNPKIRFVHDEARSWVERSDERFDIIQASLIDSWAATSAGAFVLTENSLYTREAWREFLNHLTPRGVLTMSRWWIRDRPGEMARLTSLAYAALSDIGVTHPREHVLVAVTHAGGRPGEPSGVGTMIVSRAPLSEADIARFTERCRELDFEVLLTPKEAASPLFAALLDPARHEAALAQAAFNLEAPTDDSPFFFNMLRFRDIGQADVLNQGVTDFNVRAVATLGFLLLLMVVLCVGGLGVPLWLHERSLRRAGEAPLPRGPLTRHALYFTAIGFGFILVEIGQIQRLTLFLGHPVYSLTVVLFSLLLATSAGAWLTGRFLIGRGKRRALAGVGAAFVVSLAAAWVLPDVLAAFYGQPLEPRLVTAVLLLIVLGLPLGAGFPLGLAYAAREVPRATPWLWAVNGAASVIGSILAVVISIGAGISATCLAGAVAYAFAWLLLARLPRTV